MNLFSYYMEQQKKVRPEVVNWKNYAVGDGLFYSYRDTAYDRHTYPSALHYHDYYELVVFEAGEIEYVCEGSIYRPAYGDVILIPPGNFHMSILKGEFTHYKRHVFYFYPSAFESIGYGVLNSFLQREASGWMFSVDEQPRLMSLLDQMKQLSNKDSLLDEALFVSFLIQVFYLMNQPNCQEKNQSASLPKKIAEIRQYIDENFSEISSVGQVADHFFYSREYVSRLFKKYFDTSISDYIMKRRIEKSQALILQGLPMIEVAYQVGFGSLSTFIRSFRSVTNMTPSAYRKLRKEMAG